MTDLVKYFNNSELSINLTSILILNDQTNEFEPWFIAKEVATLLGYTNASKAIGDHVDELDQKMLSYDECKVLFGQNILVDETIENTDDFRGNDSLPRNNFLKINSNGMKFINESGLYTLIARSNKPEARKFQRWVTSEVLPSIRKTGSYKGYCIKYMQYFILLNNFWGKSLNKKIFEKFTIQVNETVFHLQL